MKNLLLTIAIALSSATTFCQEEFWELLDTPEGFGFWDIEHVIDNILVASAPDSGLYITYDNGDTWQKTNFEYGCKDIEAGPNGYVYVSRYPGNNIMFSPDTCKTWLEAGDFYSPFVPTIHVLDNDAIYVGAGGSVFRSLDTCKTWEEVMDHQATEFNTDIETDPVTGEVYASFAIIYEGDEGLYSSPTGDPGTWVPRNMTDVWCSSIGFDNDGSIYVGSPCLTAGIFFNCLYRSSSNCQSWDKIFYGGEVLSMVFLPGGDIYVSTDGNPGIGDVFYKNADSANFLRLPTSLLGPHVFNIALSSNYLFAVNGLNFEGIFRSINTVASIGIQSNIAAKKYIDIFPNPIEKSKLLHINIPIEQNNAETVHCMLYNLKGQEIYNKEFTNSSTNKFSLPMNIERGIYMLKIQKGGEIYTEKIIVK